MKKNVKNQSRTEYITNTLIPWMEKVTEYRSTWPSSIVFNENDFSLCCTQIYVSTKKLAQKETNQIMHIGGNNRSIFKEDKIFLRQKTIKIGMARQWDIAL
jgi:hypothetical protein